MNQVAAPVEMMNALVLYGVGDIRHTRVPRPAVAPGQALLHIKFCGVCGSDIPRVFRKGTYRFPTICGHEFAGIIEKTAPDVKEFAAGDRVAVFPLLWCGKCAACEQGRYVQCANYDYFGSRRDGGFAQYVAVPIHNLLRVPAEVSLEEAAMIEPAAVALHALKQAGRNLVGRSVAIYGAGSIGLMVAQWARIMGAAPIILFDLVEQKLALARQMGFVHAYPIRREDSAPSIASLTAGAGVDVAVDAAGSPAALLQAMASVRRNGCVVLLGNPAGDLHLPATLWSQLLRREVTLAGVWNSEYSIAGNSDDWHATLDAMADGRINLRALITHRVPLEQAPAALRMMRDNLEFHTKVLIQP